MAPDAMGHAGSVLRSSRETEAPSVTNDVVSERNFAEAGCRTASAQATIRS
jgi:hypothetical protein